MPRASILGKIEKEVEKLSPQEQLKLVERLAHQLRKTGIAEKNNSTGLAFMASAKDYGKKMHRSMLIV